MTDLFGDPVTFLRTLIVKVPALLLAVTVHELAHGLVADRLGDPTARLQGRLTLNPLSHLDPIGALAFVLAGFGWAKPVPVNAANLRHPFRDMAWVAGAGPLSNFLVAFLALLVYRLVRLTVNAPFLTEPLKAILSYVYAFNLGLGIFNLIPLPPLDGGHFLPYFLPRGSWTLLHQLEQYGPFILILLIVTDATRFIMGPALGFMDGLFAWLVRLIL